jgi:uncharacterized protein YjbI with pentapeptide repeats
MAGQVSVDWLTCDENGCIGICLDAGDKCLAHAEDEERDAALEKVAQTGGIDARGVTISSTLLKKILDSTPGNPNDRVMSGEVLFDKATFESDVGFADVTFESFAGFYGATFQGDVVFYQATFQHNVWFRGAIFQGDAAFEGAIFQGDAGFDGVTFQGDAEFAGATFEANTTFEVATFQSTAWFDKVAIQGNAEFDAVTVQGDAWFRGATFQGDATFGWVTIQGNARFLRATFERARQFGPLLASRGLNLDGVQFAQPVRIEASTISMSCRRARFPGGVQFWLRWADVVLDDTDIPAPSLLTGIPRLTSNSSLASEQLASAEQRIARDWDQEHPGHVSERPRVLSLQRANVAGLGLANVDLSGCRFSGAHNLDKLRLEVDVPFKLSPTPVGWEQTQVIAEECTWRAVRTRPGRWTDPWWPDRADLLWPEDLEKPRALAPSAIAGLYRALRKSREDAKDEPGAADFYYGEMEMRRHAHRPADRGDGGSRGRVDRGVLTAYWLVSGYGMRAWRAIAWLAGITVAFALAFHLVGFTRPPQPASFWTSLLYAFRSTISLTDDQVGLTAWGQLLQALLRLTGPVLLGLALLALRNHVKR